VSDRARAEDCGSRESNRLWTLGASRLQKPRCRGNHLALGAVGADGLDVSLSRGNTMDQAPDGSTKPNGIDFWWDGEGIGNCWQNTSPVRRIDQ
jgi:hypothetical protein